MNDPHVNENTPAGGNPEEMRSALFAQMVMQQASMAMMLLGKTPHPESGQVVRDLEAARFFIDQLEMLEFKTKGNLTPDEATLLKQSLMSLRMAFVESVDNPPSPPPAAPSVEPSAPTTAPGAAAADDAPAKKFTKKY
jgi:hypothetical protein